jgi:uncharacterized protein (TIGR00290 family)
MPDALALSWSGGKDSALALAALRAAGTPPDVLLTVVDETTGAVAHHGVPADLLRLQAAAVGVALVTVAVPAGAGNAIYERRLRDAFARPPLAAVDGVAFGDLFLADLRRYREARMQQIGLRAWFPLWGRDTGALAHELVAGGYRAIVVSVDTERLPRDRLGSDVDATFLQALPPSVDPCGERGEFHTYVWNGPVFKRPVPAEHAGQRSDGRFAWLELSATGASLTPTPSRARAPRRSVRRG